MQILRLLATRSRAVSTITTAASCEEDKGPFFDLDFSSPSSARAASCAKISTRFRAVAGRTPRATAAVEARGLRGLRKCRSASAATVAAASRLNGSVLEKLDGIASAIAHCKESLHRASSVSGRDGSPLLRSKSDPGKWEASQASH